MNGDFRPVFLQANCATLAQLVNASPALGPVLNVVTTVLSNAQLCPTQAAAITSAARSGRLAHAASTAGPGGVQVPTLPKLPPG